MALGKTINGNTADRFFATAVNNDTVVIPAGSPVFLKLGATANGALAVAGPSGLAGAFMGVALEDIAVGAASSILIYGICNVRVAAVDVGTQGTTFLLPTAGSAGVYSFSPGVVTVNTPSIIVLNTFVAPGSEKVWATVFVRHC